MNLIIITFLIIVLLVLLFFLTYTLVFMSAMLHGPVFVRSDEKKLEAMLELARIKKSSKVIDLGSGDGKILFTVANKFNIPVEGVEINPFLVWRTKRRVARERLAKLISVRKQSFWNVDLSRYDVVFLYGTTYIMERLEKKVLTEMRPGSKLISNFFKFPNIKPTRSLGQVHLYKF